MISWKRSTVMGLDVCGSSSWFRLLFMPRPMGGAVIASFLLSYGLQVLIINNVLYLLTHALFSGLVAVL